VNTIGFDDSDLDDPEGSVLVLVDESYSPFVAAAAIVIESSEARRLNADIEALYTTWRRTFYLDGLPSFEEFRRRGFHASSDPREVKSAFVDFLADNLAFKTFIVYSDGSSMPELSEKQRLMMVLDRLLRDVLRTYHGRPKVRILFESAQELNEYFRRVATRAATATRRHGPEVVVMFGMKREPSLLALPDYVLHVFNQWRIRQGDDPPVLDPLNFQSRFFRSIEGSLSVARSIDGARVIRRGFDIERW
jgi:hypothetical protein